MQHILRVPVSDFDAFNDCFIDAMTPQRFIREEVLIAWGMEAKRSLTEKSITYNHVTLDGRLEQKQLPLEKIDLSRYMLGSDPKYGNDKKSAIDVKVGELLWERLDTYSQIIMLRLEKFHESQDAYWDHTKSTERPRDPPPTCIEELLASNLAYRIQEKIMEREKKLLDDESKAIKD